MSDLEVQLLEAMIKIRVRFSNGSERIQACFNLVEEVAIEMETDPEWQKFWQLHKLNLKKP